MKHDYERRMLSRRGKSWLQFSVNAADEPFLSIDTLQEIRMRQSFSGTSNHSHTFYQILWIQKGAVDERLNFEHHRAKGNELVFIAPSQEHKILTCTEGIKGYRINFSEVFVSDLDKDIVPYIRDVLFNSMAQSHYKITNECATELQAILDALIEKLQNAQTSRLFQILSKTLFTQFIATFLQYNSFSLATDTDSSGLALSRLFATAVEQNIRKQRSIDFYIKALKTSYRDLANACLYCSGLSPKAYINAYTLREAKQLLCNSSLRVKEIATELGFATTASFSRFFAAQSGMSPSDFRIFSKQERP